MVGEFGQPKSARRHVLLLASHKNPNSCDCGPLPISLAHRQRRANMTAKTLSQILREGSADVHQEAESNPFVSYVRLIVPIRRHCFHRLLGPCMSGVFRSNLLVIHSKSVANHCCCRIATQGYSRGQHHAARVLLLCPLPVHHLQVCLCFPCLHLAPSLLAGCCLHISILVRDGQPELEG